MGGSTNVKESWPAIFMLLIQIFTTGLMLLTKVVVDSGSLAWTLLTYRFFLGAILAIKQHLIIKIFTIPGFTYIGLGDTSLGCAVNFYNIIPIVAFILAVLFWKEPLDMRSLVGNIKVVRTLVGVGGTLVISLYKGKVLHLWPTNIIGYHPKQAGAAFGHHHVRGTILLITSSLSLAVWYTVQAILNITTKFVMILWVVTQHGPTYPAMFCAVTVFFTTILDSLLLGHDLSVGSVLGMFMILVGLYLFLWGKRKESVPPSEENPKEQMLFQGGDKNDKTQMNELRLRTIEGTGKRRFISMFTPLEGR
ncbi:WAT1-related protein At1g44800-like [Triticum aestivum]|uniref:WAT1-related protein At1g44800-like n=1 Tax=Triticum aestivum TaxID=4565 RepID=UPI001D006C33|nr:WAT1-related protein At1g44800-like [Triticum aestivum]XP_044379025.1 WAT1-related protein At1g44800-like [Triticum aestivum]